MGSQKHEAKRKKNRKERKKALVAIAKREPSSELTPLATEKHDPRLLRQARLQQMSAKRLISHGAPDFGAKEGDILKLNQQVQQLTLANNNMAGEIDTYRKNGLLEKTLNNNLMLSVVLRFLTDAKICTEAEVHERCRQLQMDNAGLNDKGPGLPLEDGDTIIMVFQLFEGENLVEDQTKQDMAYKVGSKGLPCDDGMIGMQVGESRYFDVVFGEGLVRKDLIGKSLRMLVLCKAIKVNIERPEGKQPQG